MNAFCGNDVNRNIHLPKRPSLRFCPVHNTCSHSHHLRNKSNHKGKSFLNNLSAKRHFFLKMKSELLDDNDVVISGIGCKLPEIDSLSELTEKLFEGAKLTNTSVLDHGGRIKYVKKFDNTFFGISHIVSRSMDPLTRLVLERTFEAVVDAGINPADLKGTDTNVFSGMTFSDFDLAWLSETKGGYNIMGKNRSLNSNRVSYWLDLNGTSASYHAHFAAGMQNLAAGWKAIRDGSCDTAIINTANVQIKSEIINQLNDLKKYSEDENCRPYDDSANGFCRGEAIVVLVLQRAKYAKRCYAVVDHVFLKCYGDSENVLGKPRQQEWERMLQEFYSESNINVNDISYVEGDGGGIKEEDAEELNALTSIFCKNRKSPLLIGSIKSNVGHTEASSVFCSLLKAIVALERRVIPKSINYSSPNSLSPGLTNGKIKIVTENTSISSNELIAVNAYSVGGVYGHLVVRGNPKIKKPLYDGIPRLVLLSARQDEFFDEVADKIEGQTLDLEHVGLMHDLFSKKMEKYLSRGYTIVPKVNDESLREHEVYSEEKRPVWFIFSGMGSQWCAMGKRLMDLPIFRHSIEKSHKVLAKKGLDLIDIITTEDPKIFDNILHSFVGIAAIQIALVDLLNALGIVPDKMIGHSVGEQGCAYADGCLTAEQTILSAYFRGLASLETPLVKGFMAAIGKGYNEIKDELPEGIEVACRNSANSCTISGTAELVQNYVKQLQDRKVFARTVNVANIAYHSQYIKPIAPKLLQYLKDIIPERKLRSEKWISTSNLEENWDSDLAKYCSAEYLTNNLLSSVYFEEGSRKIPNNAICIEIAPHGLLQAILKRSLSEKCTNVPLTNRTAKDPLRFFLQAIGKMYMAGMQPQIQKLYTKIEYPVSRNTRSLQDLVKWQHSRDFKLPKSSGEKKVVYSLKKQLLETCNDGVGYLIDETNYYPLSVFLYLVWEIFASSRKMKTENCPVEFENIRVEKFLPIHTSKKDKAHIFVGLGTGLFEIVLEDTLIVKGQISLSKDVAAENINEEVSRTETITKTEVYDEFDRKGCIVGDNLRNIESVGFKGNVYEGKIRLSSHWLQTLESMFQLAMLKNGQTHQALSLPSAVEKITILPKKHDGHIRGKDKTGSLVIKYNRVTNIINCGGIEIKGLKLHEKNENLSTLKFESIQFVPFENSPLQSLESFLDFCLNVVTENINESKINVLEIVNGIKIPSIASYLEKNFGQFKINTIRVPYDEVNKTKKVTKNDLVVTNSPTFEEAISQTNEGGFIFVKFTKKHVISPKKVEVIANYSLNGEEFVLLRKIKISHADATYIKVTEDELNLNSAIKNLEKSKITYLVTYDKLNEGSEKFKKRLQKETSAELKWLVLLDEKAPTLDPESNFYKSQIRKGLATNVYFNGSWGSLYRKTFTHGEFETETFLNTTDTEVDMAYVGIEFDDTLTPGNLVEYSGRLKNGNKVMGIGTIQDNKLTPDSCLQWNVPPSWTLEEGATVPSSFALAYFCLKIEGDVRPYESVLVTDGLSYNGLAVISVALSFKVRVYATVNKEEEILQLKKIFPALNETDILNHEDGDFDLKLRLITKYPELIVNNLEEERLILTLNCLPGFGRIFHLGNKDGEKNNSIGMSYFMYHSAIYGVSTEKIGRLPSCEKEEIKKFIAMGLKTGLIKPLPKIVHNFTLDGKLKNLKEVLETQKKNIFKIKDSNFRLKRFSVDPKASYIIIGDESDFWIDIAEWLIGRNAFNITISLIVPSSKDSHRIQSLKKHPTLAIRNHRDVASLFDDTQKLGPVAAVFVVRMNHPNGLKSFAELDTFYRDSQSPLIVLSSKEDSLTKSCMKRTSQGYASFNFVWNAKKKFTNQSLDIIEKLSGEESVIYVSDSKNTSYQSQNTDKLLAEILPSSLEKFYDLGSYLQREKSFIELPTLGPKNSDSKEIPPFFIIPGFQDNPIKMLLPFAKKLMYPLFLVQLPYGTQKYSIEQQAKFLLPKIQTLNKLGRAYNILGISWGSYIAIELAKLIEKSGEYVSLTLVNGPLKTLKESLILNKSLENDLVNLVQAIFNKVPIVTEPESFSSQINQILETLNLSGENQIELLSVLKYICNNLQAMLEYDESNIKLKGPVAIINSEEMLNFPAYQICNNILVRNLAVPRKEILACEQLINIVNGSVITMEMSDHTIHYCSYEELEEYLTREKMEVVEDEMFKKKIADSGLRYQIMFPYSAEEENDYVLPL